MNLTTISEISKSMNISTRTLRYYEQIGLIESVKKDDYAYRTYDEATVTRLQQILVLRKLRIPLKQIALILKSENTAAIIDAFQQNLAEVDDEITALSTIRDIINTFIMRLKESIHQDIKLNLLDDTALLEAVDTLTIQKIPLKEEKTSVDLEQASEKLNKLTDRDVRIVYLPPATVASAYAVGCEPGPELATVDIVDKFIKDTNLKDKYPASRHFGFNNPDEPVHGEGHGYERYITIPDDMEAPSPLVKKHFVGGLYAAHTIPMGAWDEWFALHEWVGENDHYEFRWETIEGVCGWIEEHLNYWDWNDSTDDYRQIDLMIPVKPKFAASTKHPQERVIDTLKYNDMPIEVIEWDDTIWCGKIGYAANNIDVPDIGSISDGFLAQDHNIINERLETAANTLLHFDFHSLERPSAAMFAFLVDTDNQPDGFDVRRVPAGKYMRIALVQDSAKALGVEPWNGGPPPEEWISERLAPQFGYKQVFDLPVIEHYGYLNDSTGDANAFLYVPVEKI